MITYCDVNTCEDCPRYGDDCDGDKRVEHTDYISRADAIEAVASITMSIHLSDVICDKLLALPSAEAVQGKWIMHIDDLFPCESTQECSVCHAEQLISISDDNFCPNCGARMKGGAE